MNLLIEFWSGMPRSLAARCFAGRRIVGFAMLIMLGLADARAARPAWDESIVTIEVARKQYDYYQPWSRRTHRTQKTGVILGNHQILTTADELFDHTLIRLQKHGRGQWWIGEIAWVDYHANLALLTNSDAEFWRGLEPVAFADATPSRPLQIMRWREGKLESRAAEFTQFTVREGQLSPLSSVALELSSEIQGVGWGEPVISNGKVAGLLVSQDGRNCVATPSGFFEPILNSLRHGAYRGLGYFHFYWQPAENPASLARLKLPGAPRGVIVTDVPHRQDGLPNVLQPEDVLLKIGGFDLDIQGDYQDPDFGSLMLENLAVRGKCAGDTLDIQIWRAGRDMEVAYRLPRMAYTNSLVPDASYDHDPEYLIVGGLVFQPLTDAYLQSWGADWKRSAPFRLNFYREQARTKKRPALVMLSQVLPDPYNIGYQDQKYLVLESVNGQPVHYLAELQDALRHPRNGYDVLEFQKGESLREMVLAGGQAENDATTRILKRYSIPSASCLAQPEP